MEKLNWAIDTSYLKTEETWQPLTEGEIYTLQMPDFFRMPDMDFVEIATYDPQIKALFN